ncbi:hypothetical protein ACET6W_18585 [Aeromonas veronii]|uniref:hypothetical protein n=1 Tax=Aeromonas veronii TaxID=654 RepID=UPI002B468B1E|nr:hypothetical protein [Aeromonas veronii]
MDLILKNLPLFGAIGTAIAFVIGLFRWIDQRSREQEQRTYEAFHKMICLASGTDESGRTIKMAQQIAAIYQLQRYKQYAFASIPVLKLIQFEFANCEDSRADHLEQALRETIDILGSD